MARAMILQTTGDANRAKRGALLIQEKIADAIIRGIVDANDPTAVAKLVATLVREMEKAPTPVGGPAPKGSGPKGKYSNVTIER